MRIVRTLPALRIIRQVTPPGRRRPSLGGEAAQQLEDVAGSSIVVWREPSAPAPPAVPGARPTGSGGGAPLAGRAATGPSRQASVDPSFHSAASGSAWDSSSECSTSTWGHGSSEDTLFFDMERDEWPLSDQRGAPPALQQGTAQPTALSAAAAAARRALGLAAHGGRGQWPWPGDSGALPLGLPQEAAEAVARYMLAAVELGQHL